MGGDVWNGFSLFRHHQIWQWVSAILVIFCGIWTQRTHFPTSSVGCRKLVATENATLAQDAKASGITFSILDLCPWWSAVTPHSLWSTPDRLLVNSQIFWHNFSCNIFVNYWIFCKCLTLQWIHSGGFTSQWYEVWGYCTQP